MRSMCKQRMGAILPSKVDQPWIYRASDGFDRLHTLVNIIVFSYVYLPIFVCGFLDLVHNVFLFLLCYLMMLTILCSPRI
jgi:hypothetical protein